MQDNVTLEIIYDEDGKYPDAVFTFHCQDSEIQYNISEPYCHRKREWLEWKANVENNAIDVIQFHTVSGEGKGDEMSLYVQLSKKVFGKSLVKCIEQMIANPDCWNGE